MSYIKQITLHKAEMDWNRWKPTGETPRNGEKIFCVTIDSLPIAGVYKVLFSGDGVVVIRDDTRWQESYKGWDDIRSWFSAGEVDNLL